MTSLYRTIIFASWILGLLAIVLALVTKALHLAMKMRVEPSTFMVIASTFFLCALATKALDRT